MGIQKQVSRVLHENFRSVRACLYDPIKSGRDKRCDHFDVLK